MQPEYDLCVIGGGSAGLVAAAGAATLGAKVVLVEKHLMGGDCLNFGCVPSKALLHVAKVAHTLQRAERLGFAAPDLRMDMRKTMAYVAAVIAKIAPNDSAERFRGLGVEVIFGAGQFTGADVFTVNQQAIRAKKFVLATGSRTALPSIPGLDQVNYLTNESIFAVRHEVPALIVLGAGPIGVEMAQAFARLGSEVHVVQRGARVLPKADVDAANLVMTQLASEGVQWHLNATPLRIDANDDGIQLLLQTAEGNSRTLSGSHVLVATGRQANVDNLGLELAGVQVKDGRVVTDARLRSSNPRIFAAGDVVGGHPFTHVAEHHAGVILRNAIFHLPAKVETRVIPYCTFTDPELAQVGLTAAEAEARGIAHQVFRFPFHDIDRAITDDDTVGFAKVVADPKGHILGATIVGAQAGELIHEYAMAMSQRLKLSALSGLIHVYPTRAQINRRVADQRLKAGLTPLAKRWIRRIFGLRG